MTATAGLSSKLNGLLLLDNNRFHSCISFGFDNGKSDAFSKGLTKTSTAQLPGNQVMVTGWKLSGDFVEDWVTCWTSFKTVLHARGVRIVAKSKPVRFWFWMTHSKTGLNRFRLQPFLWSRCDSSTSAENEWLNGPIREGTLPTTEQIPLCNCCHLPQCWSNCQAHVWHCRCCHPCPCCPHCHHSFCDFENQLFGHHG